MTRREKFLRIAASAVLAGLFVFASVEAASTIGLNIYTGGTLSTIGNTHLGADGFIYGGDLAIGTGTATSTLKSAAQRLGVATSSPYGVFSISATSSLSTLPIFVVSTSTAAATTTGLIVDYNGKLGVGTTSPYADLSVAGVIAGSILNVNSDVATSTFLGGASIATKVGNLGVGSLTPRAALHVVGDGLFSTDVAIIGGDLSIGTGLGTSTITSTQGMLGVGGGTTTPSALFSISATNTSANNKVARFLISTSTASATSTAFIVDAEGRVGVRTSSPSAGVSFEVAGIASTSQLIVGGNQTTSVISNILFGTCTFNPANIMASSTISTNCTGATGVDTTFNVFVTPVWLENGLVFTSASATAADTIQVSVLNTGNASGTAYGTGIDPVSRTWYWMGIK